ncbi:GntR family transcriptional regulator [Limnoglobus roseus]|uniref:GntR family transcriptional regulator n=1 Tax=Limnoglobus roseus TaxID=2598579 RepID=A0A5C1AI60_9BACT|nr:GntR family transcriptional regulator [Limnoglobus roseus]QEL17943.1 GntR family transcriptional regulator [Limnoglobus roseus]
MADRITESGHVPSATGQPRGSMKERAYEEIKQQLMSGDYLPGSFLSERALAERLGMSKTPVKGALERLEGEGFITVSPQQGIVVREMPVEEITDQYEIRTALETFVLRTVAGRLTAVQVEQIQKNLADQEATRGRAAVERAVALDAGFHVLFAEFLGNREILRVTRHLRDRMQRIITRVFLANPSRTDTSIDEHTAIAAAVIDGNGPRAARLIEDHLERGKSLILSPRS